MNETENLASGIEVQEQALSNYELGFVAGVYAAWGIMNPTELDFQDAMKLLMAQKYEAASPEQFPRALRLVASRPR
jgi:hypothetical protein